VVNDVTLRQGARNSWDSKKDLLDMFESSFYEVEGSLNGFALATEDEKSWSRVTVLFDVYMTLSLK
jgi:hypothetical protein